MCETIRLPYQPEMINYGEKKVEGKGLGDPIGVSKDKRPNTKSINKVGQRSCKQREAHPVASTYAHQNRR